MPEKPEKFSNPPIGVPVSGFNSPGHLEADYVDVVDLTTSLGATRLAPGTLYNTIVGGDQNIVNQFPGLFLLHEVIEPRAFPYVYRYWASAFVSTSGQDYDQTWDVVVPYVDAFLKQGDEIGTNREDISVINRQLARKRTFDPTVLNAVFGNYLNYFSNTANLRLPEVLLSLTGIENSASGSGTYAEHAAGGGSGSDWFVSQSEHGRGQASASISLDVAIEYKQYWGQNIPIITYFFFLQSPVTASQIITKLQTLTGLTILAWPKFVPQGHTIIALGQKVNLEAQTKSGYQLSNSSSGSSASDTAGQGNSIDVSTSRHAIRIPPMIHGALAIGGVTSDVITESAYSRSTDPVNDVIENPSKNCVALITPTSFAATSPSSVPTTGLRLLNSDVAPYRFGWARVSAEVVDFANVA